MRIVLDLSAKDIAYFRKCLQTVKKGKRGQDESVVLKAATELIVDSALRHGPHAVTSNGQCSRVRISAHRRQRPVAQTALERGGMRKLGRGSESAVTVTT